MQKILAVYLIIMNLAGLALMGIDKRKAIKGRFRIPEKTLFLTAILGGSIGSIIGMYLFHHKTRKYRFSVGLPVILVVQLLLTGFLSGFYHNRILGPSAAVENELSLIQQLDEAAIQNFISYEALMNKALSSSKVGPEAGQAVELFFQNFEYEILSEKIQEDQAAVEVRITNLDARALAHDLGLALTAENLDLEQGSRSPETFNDFFILLKNTLETHVYDPVSSSVCFHLKKEGEQWIIQPDETLQDELVGGFLSAINDPYLLTPQEVLTIYLDEFGSLSGEQWIQYLKIDDLFSTNSPAYHEKLDLLFMDKIAEYFTYTIDTCQENGAAASIQITLTSIDMGTVLEVYKEKLLKYASTSESITADETSLADSSAKYLMEALEESAGPASTIITVNLFNDGHNWQLDISPELTNAFLGNFNEALADFKTE